jgi:hypothetical protein
MGGLCHLEIPGLGQNPLAIIGLYHPSSILGCRRGETRLV